MNQLNLPVENDVLIGNDGWLYLYGGTNLVGELFARPTEILKGVGSSWVGTLTSRKTRINDLGAEYFHFWVPDKLAVYPEFIPSQYIPSSRTPTELMLDEYLGLHKGIVIDLLPSLLKGKASNLMYWKTDTHWTYEGAYAAYEAICNALGSRVLGGLLGRPKANMEIALDLGGKLTPPIKEVCHFVQVLLNAQISEKNELVKFLELIIPKYHAELHVGTAVKYTNSAANRDPRKILIFGDSYCEYRPNSLSALLAETFQDLMFVWSANLDYELIKHYKPDIVLTEMAERFLGRVPSDDFDLSEAVFRRVADFLNRKCLVAERSRSLWTFQKKV